MSWANTARIYLKDTYSIDLRALVVLRVGLALIILFDLGIRVGDLDVFYTDTGVLPRFASLAWGGGHIIPFHYVSGSAGIEVILFLVAAVFAVMLVFGYKTRWATIASWLLLLSLHDRNREIIMGGDFELRQILFWGMFLPLNVRWSIDAALSEGFEHPEANLGGKSFSWAGVALLVQAACMYFFSFFMKSGPAWRQDYSALYRVYSVDELTNDLGRWLLHFPSATRWMTVATLIVEFSAPLMLLFPWRKGWLRIAGCLALIGLQSGIMLTMHVGPFPYISILVLVALLPSTVWDHIFHHSARPLKVYFDEGCPFCITMCKIIRELFFCRHVNFLPAQCDAKMLALMREKKSWIAMDAACVAHFKTDALAELLSVSQWFMVRWTSTIIRRADVQNFGDTVYTRIEQNRERLSHFVDTMRPSPVITTSTPVMNIVVVFFIVLILAHNLVSVRWTSIGENEIGQMVQLFHLEQNWKMFAPEPINKTGWYVVPALLADGDEVDLFRNGTTVSFTKPSKSVIAAQLPNERWRTYLVRMAWSSNMDQRRELARFLCHRWNENRDLLDPMRAKSMEIDHFERKVAAIGEPEENYHEIVLIKYECGY